MSANAVTPYRTYQCQICGFCYDEAGGILDEGIPPGTRWEKIPPNWMCPDCGAPKRDFEPIGT
ncbi:MAG: rubredoxin [Rhodocyclaceae bacterium]